MPVEALLLPLRMPLFCSFEIIALVGCGIGAACFLIFSLESAAVSIGKTRIMTIGVKHIVHLNQVPA